VKFSDFVQKLWVIFAFKIIKKPKKTAKTFAQICTIFCYFLHKGTIVGLLTHILLVWDEKSLEYFLDRIKTFLL
jgi:hypothetical protein